MSVGAALRTDMRDMGGRYVTTIKEKAVEMIQRMPEDNMPYVLHMLQRKRQAESRESSCGYLKNGKKAAGRVCTKKRAAGSEAGKIRLSGLNEKKIRAAIENGGFMNFEDCLQEECAAEVMADYIVKRNLGDYKTSRVKAVEPDKFIKLL